MTFAKIARIDGRTTGVRFCAIAMRQGRREIRRGAGGESAPRPTCVRRRSARTDLWERGPQRRGRVAGEPIVRATAARIRSASTIGKI